MKQILAEEQSAYSVNEQLKKTAEKSNYATVWRHIKKMKEKNLINIAEALRKNGKIDNRNTEILSLTNNGLATLLIEGDIQEEELNLIGQQIIQGHVGKTLLSLLTPVLTKIFSNALLKIKPRVNLKFFDDNYFNELFVTSFVETMIELLPETNLKLEEKELQKLLTYSQKMAKKEGTDEFYKIGFEFGKNLKKTKEKKD